MQAPPDPGAAAAVGDQPPAAVTPFPAPPPFYRLYARGALAGPPPPPCPARPTDALVVFGAEHRAVEDPVLPALQVPDLLRQAGVADSPSDPRPALHLLLDAVLAAALRLLDTLVEAPGQYAAQATAAITALHNLMHRVNALRPAQTRHALAAALEAQVEHKRAAARAVREAARAAGEEVARRAATIERAAAVAAAAAAAAAGAGVGGGSGDAMEVEEGGIEGVAAAAVAAGEGGGGGQQQKGAKKARAAAGRGGGGGGGG